MEEMREDNKGLQLLDDDDYFTILDHLNLLIFTIKGKEGLIFDIQEPSGRDAPVRVR